MSTPSTDPAQDAINVSQQFAQHYRDPISESTRKRQSNLLIASAVSILVSFSIVQTGVISVGGAELHLTDNGTFKTWVGVVTCYFLFAYAFSAWRDLEEFNLQIQPAWIQFASDWQVIRKKMLKQNNHWVTEMQSKNEAEAREGNRLEEIRQKLYDEKTKVWNDEFLVSTQQEREEWKKRLTEVQAALDDAEKAVAMHSEKRWANIREGLATLKDNPDSVVPDDALRLRAQVDYRLKIAQKALLLDKWRMFLEFVMPVALGVYAIFKSMIQPYI